MIRQTFLKVWANPWHALDHMGRPSGHCAKERSANTPGHAGYVGCSIVASAPIVLEPGHAGTPDQDTCWHFDREAVTVPDTAYYRAKVASDELFAADEATARKSEAKFLPLDEALKASKDAAYAKWHAAFGEDPEAVDPYARPRPNGAESPMDIAAKSGAERAPEAHKAAEAKANEFEAKAMPVATESPSEQPALPESASVEPTPVTESPVDEPAPGERRARRNALVTPPPKETP